ncbi:MAG: cytochrome c-type biogenesis protein [Acidimicrobiales bacterium]
MAEVRRWRGRIGFAAAIVVAAAALAIGSGLGASSPQTPAQRASAVESRIRCPSCDDISVAESEAGSAVAVRHEITGLVAQGRTDGEIEAHLVAQYGSSILLVPPASGVSLLVWVVPAAAGALAAGVLAALVWRRSASWRRLRAAR